MSKQNDFRSLLNSFQKATGGNPKKDNESRGKTSSKKMPKTSVKDRIHEVYTTNLLKQSLLEQEQKHEKARKTEAKIEEEKKSHKEFKIHMAICICIIDFLPHETVWRHWIEEGEDEPCCFTHGENKIFASADLHIHAKFPEKLTSPFVKSKLLPYTHSPNWNDYRVIHAMVSLCNDALSKNKDNDKYSFIQFCTESCIPVTSLEMCVSELLTKSKNIVSNEVELKSFLKDYPRTSVQCTRFDERQCFDPLLNTVPNAALSKALPGWITLCQTDAELILEFLCNFEDSSLETFKEKIESNEFISLFQRVWAPEEVFFSTTLQILHRSTYKDNLMHVEWSKHDRAHPNVFNYVNNEVVRRARLSGCLFLRKIRNKVHLSDWQSVILGIDKVDRLRKRARLN